MISSSATLPGPKAYDLFQCPRPSYFPCEWWIKENEHPTRGSVGETSSALNCTSSEPRRFFRILPSEKSASFSSCVPPCGMRRTRRRLVVLVKASDEARREFIHIDAECVMRRNVEENELRACVSIVVTPEEGCTFPSWILCLWWLCEWACACVCVAFWCNG